MKPESPVLPGYESLIPETVFARDQEQYNALPAISLDNPEGEVITRWRPSEEELELLNAGEALYLHLWTFHEPLQPILMQVCTPETIANRLIPSEAEFASQESQ